MASLHRARLLFVATPALLLFAATPALATAPSGNAKMIVILHEGHTGTHALCEALGKLDCVHADCGEPTYSESNMRSFVQQAGNAGKPYAVRMYPSYQSNVPRSLAGLNWGSRLKLFPHVRLDLMRYALSRYCKHGGGCSWERNDPQFNHIFESARHYYSMSQAR